MSHQLRAADGSAETVVAIHRHTGVQEMRDLTVADTHTYYVVAGDTPVLVHNCRDVAESSLAAAERARDQAGLKPDGTPNRESPVYVGGYDAKGNVMGTGNGPRGSGVHAEDIIQWRMPGAQMTEPYAWRRNIDMGEPEWQPFIVGATCQ